MIDSGCFGHFCPLWRALQVPRVTSTNVEVVAANNVALHHFGLKVVYGHVTTNSGKRILIQITVDVMNVRKFLLTISALKHRGVTIHNQDCDRITFRNETAGEYVTWSSCSPNLHRVEVSHQQRHPWIAVQKAPSSRGVVGKISSQIATKRCRSGCRGDKQIFKRQLGLDSFKKSRGFPSY